MPGRFSFLGGASDEQATAEQPAAKVDQPTEAEAVDAPNPPGFAERGRLRRRLRTVRQQREVGLRDLGGLVFDLRRFEQERPDLVAAKLDALSALDMEMRALESVLDDRRDVIVLREPGLTGCSACGALLGSEAHFCSNCATPVAESPPAAEAAVPTGTPDEPAAHPSGP